MKLDAIRLRDEGVLELGRAQASSVMFVLTQRRLVLFHVHEMPARRLDAWGIARAIERLEDGAAVSELAADLEIDMTQLGRALATAGWIKPPASRGAWKRGRRISRGRGPRGAQEWDT